LIFRHFEHAAKKLFSWDSWSLSHWHDASIKYRDLDLDYLDWLKILVKMGENGGIKENILQKEEVMIFTWWLIPLSKWV